MKTTICPICEFESAQERLYASTVEREGERVTVDGLKHFVCPQCQGEFVDEEQSRFNLSLSQHALGEERRFVEAHQIREWRLGIGLTQRECARLLGGGVNAFSKYEKGEVVPADAMDNLLWLVMRYPGVIADLAERKNLPLSQAIKKKCGYVLQFTSTWQETRHIEAGWQASSTAFSFWDAFPFRMGLEWREYTITAANDTELVFEAAA
jgi:HTH-type transcriptional regulator / antitoxin MqsA